MDKHKCKWCGDTFNYCRACMFKPIYYHDAGFCSEECCTAFRLAEKNKEISDKDQEIHE